MQELKVYTKPIKKSMLGTTIAGAAYYRKSEADKVIAGLEEKVEELTGELRVARPTFKCAECGEVGQHKWVWNGKEGADFVARRCCAKCIKEKGLTLWPRDNTCEEKCKAFNALKAENTKFREERRWRKCSEDGEPQEYDGQDWVVVQFIERDTGFKLIPRVAEWGRKSKKWNMLGDVDKCYEDYIQRQCVAIGWTEIPAAPEE